MRKQAANKAESHEQQPMRLTRQIGQTTYQVNVQFSETSKETMGYKIIRLIKNETQSNEHRQQKPLAAPLKTVPQMRPTARKEGAMNNDLTILYERLSREDERENESVSIENQKVFLEDYATKNGFINLITQSKKAHLFTPKPAGLKRSFKPAKVLCR